jgi:hypothetical protein
MEISISLDIYRIVTAYLFSVIIAALIAIKMMKGLDELGTPQSKVFICVCAVLGFFSLFASIIGGIILGSVSLFDQILYKKRKR